MGSRRALVWCLCVLRQAIPSHEWKHVSWVKGQIFRNKMSEHCFPLLIFHPLHIMHNLNLKLNKKFSFDLLKVGATTCLNIWATYIGQNIWYSLVIGYENWAQMDDESTSTWPERLATIGAVLWRKHWHRYFLIHK